MYTMIDVQGMLHWSSGALCVLSNSGLLTVVSLSEKTFLFTMFVCMSISKDVACAVVLLPCNKLMHVIPVSLQVMFWYGKILGMRNATCVCVCVYTHA